MNRKRTLQIATLIKNREYNEVANILSKLDRVDVKYTWGWHAAKLIPFLLDINTPAPFSIFVKGNSKLPFYSFSNLPLVNCPGAGECVKWCYSLKSWRFPSPFLRQVQNTILINEQSDQLNNAWVRLPNDCDVRLYVDGDFNTLSTMEYWFSKMESRKDLKVYGYSKSWCLFNEYNNSDKPFPENYILNVSSGSRYDNNKQMVDMINSLPITRGNFIAVEAGSNPTGKQVREVGKLAGIKNTFACPGKCGNCLLIKGKNVHACGSMIMKGRNILIGTH